MSTDPSQSLFQQLGLAVFAKSDGGLNWYGPAPTWWAPVFGDRSPENSDFVVAFLSDARAHWKSGSPAALPSGIWEETGADNETHHLRASALNSEEGQFLIIEHLARDGLANPFGLQQRLHESALERRQLEREIQKKTVLLDCVVHDLSGPLSTIMVNLQHLRKLTDDEDIRWSVETAMSQAERQRKLIHFISDLFSADLQSLSGHYADPTDAPKLTDVTRAIIEAYRQAAKERSIDIDFASEIPAELRVAGEKEHLGRVIENLLGNALRHSPSCGRIFVRLFSENDGEATLEILDEGHGVNPEIAERVFEPRVQGPGKHGRSGLGLHFCKSTITLWGGEIGFENRPQGGARFWFRLPIIVVSA